MRGIPLSTIFEDMTYICNELVKYNHMDTLTMTDINDMDSLFQELKELQTVMKSMLILDDEEIV